jgi:hypothetical protein
MGMGRLEDFSVVKLEDDEVVVVVLSGGRSSAVLLWEYYDLSKAQVRARVSFLLVRCARSRICGFLCFGLWYFARARCGYS